MLQNIPTHVIAGPLGAGKTSLIRHLLAQKPEGERWAVLINEFGQIGLDAALLTRADDGIALGEVAGGCVCCVNGAPFQVGLGRLLRKAKPDRLFIEPSGLGHPAQILRQLGAAPWLGVLSLQPCVLVLDARALAVGKPLPESQQEALALAGLLLLNKSQGLDEAERERALARLPECPVRWSEQGALELEELLALAAPQAGERRESGVLPAVPANPVLPAIWADPTQPICLDHVQEGNWSIGWRWHPSQQLDAELTRQWLSGLDWLRAKLVIHSPDGWLSANAVDNSTLQWQPSEWRRDSRIELIFAEKQGGEGLKAGMAGCRVPG
ncbi:CobW family GTP-binding protein [Pseudomonas gingeri]|uniref:CobW family GTP-binding protein n=1 Tax=Pseudomonas gingeri TaxID=117681 RepID=UPI0015A0F65F|nr:CobW-like GTP-binding protein [Pseudomonas gingeri]NWA05032.1 cobalamin biosynthesis protein CobW [Pseudomonas gingeri]NWA18225.1 cobalamin biosynthesis protein CobW [Pseudomonas gingeri]NWA58595.1 cobalamin biosynthesis protein CobW [Pseudomonas gingeri]NWA99578.1 cobalamin biosynthesis protein CobW [Pseudomonas gingeri]NWA99733.1 cobalamin biosynthesis protein CobW [Pseudomonas gingeri]